MMAALLSSFASKKPKILLRSFKLNFQLGLSSPWALCLCEKIWIDCNWKLCVSKAQIFPHLWILTQLSPVWSPESSCGSERMEGECEEGANGTRACCPGSAQRREMSSRGHAFVFCFSRLDQPTMLFQLTASFLLPAPLVGISRILSKREMTSNGSTPRHELIMAAKHRALLPKTLLGNVQLKCLCRVAW